MPQQKLICRDCDTIMNRRSKRGVRTSCWNCDSQRIGPLVESVEEPTTAPEIPIAPDISGLKMPIQSPQVQPSGGGITAQMLLQARAGLKRVVRPPVVLPGARRAAIPRGVRLMAHQIKNKTVGDVQLEFSWAFSRGANRQYIYTKIANRSLSTILERITKGLENPEHRNYNSQYRNLGTELPIRRGNFSRNLGGVSYYEYGWKTTISSNASWTHPDGTRIGPRDAGAINRYIRNKLNGQLFCERVIVAGTGEVFYTPDHYYSFKRYHPGTDEWYWYRSAGGSAGPTWDESFYDSPYGD